MDKTERRFSSCSSLGKGPMEAGTNDYIKYTPPSRHVGKERSLSSSSSTPSQIKNKNSHYVSSFYHPLDKNKMFLPSENSLNKFKGDKIQKEIVKSVDKNSKNLVFEKLTSQPFSSRLRSDSCPQVCHSNQISLPNKCHNSHASNKSSINNNSFVYNDLLKNNSQLNNMFKNKINNNIIKKSKNADISRNNPFAKSKDDFTDPNQPFCLVFNKNKIDENISNKEHYIKNYSNHNQMCLGNKKFKENQENYSINDNNNNNNNNVFIKNKYTDQFNNSLNLLTNNFHKGAKDLHKESRKFSLGQNSPLVTRKFQNNGLFSPTASSKILNSSFPLNNKNIGNAPSNNIILNRYPFNDKNIVNMTSNSNIDKKMLNNINNQNNPVVDSFDVELNDLLEFNLALDPANFSNQILVSENNNAINNRKYTTSHCSNLDANKLIDKVLLDGGSTSKDCLSVHTGNGVVDMESSYEDLNDEFDSSLLHQDLPQNSAAFNKNLQPHLVSCQQNNFDKNFNKSPNILSKKHPSNSNKNLLSTNQPHMNTNPYFSNLNQNSAHSYNQETTKKPQYKDPFLYNNDNTLYSDNTYNDNAPYNVGNFQYSPNLRRTIRGSFRSNNDIHNLRSPSDFPAKYKSTNLSTIHDEAMYNNNNNNNNDVITDINNNIINSYDSSRGFNNYGNTRRPQPKFHRLSSYEPGLNSQHKLQKSLNNNNNFYSNNLNNQLSKASSEQQLTFHQNNLYKTKNLSFDETNINKRFDKKLDTNLNNDNKSYVSSVFLNLTPNNNDLGNKFDFENLDNIDNINNNNNTINNNNNNNDFESIGPICDNIFIKNERNKNMEKNQKNINNKNNFNKNDKNNNKGILSREQLTEKKGINAVRPSTLFLHNNINNKNNNNNNNNINDRGNNKNNNGSNALHNNQEVNRLNQVIHKQNYANHKQDDNLINNNNNNNNNNSSKNNKNTNNNNNNIIKDNINNKIKNKQHLDKSINESCKSDASRLTNKQLQVLSRQKAQLHALMDEVDRLSTIRNALLTSLS